MNKLQLHHCLLLIVMLCVMTSCAVSYGDSISRNTQRFSQEPCDEKAENIFLHFAGDEINFEYEEIGIIEVCGNEGATDAQLLDHLKYEAWTNCANAVINIRTSYKERESGTLFSDDEDLRIYTSTVYKGMAVKITFKSLYTEADLEKDTRFKETVSKESEKKTKKFRNEMIVSAIGTVLGLVLVIALL